LGRQFAASLIKLGAGKRKVIVIKKSYTTGVNLAECLAQPVLAADTGLREERCAPLPLSRVQQMYSNADRMIDDVIAGFAAAVAIDPKPIFCNDAGCATHDDAGLYFRDSAHLTTAGSEFLIGRARGLLLQEVARR
jgi:hypothetical protein